MTAYSGDLTLIKIGDGATPVESFTALAGIRVVQWRIEQTLLAAQDVQDSIWRVLQPHASRRALRIDAEGIFTHSAAEQAMLAQVLAGTVRHYEIHFPDTDGLRGPFAVTRYERTGDIRDAEQCRITLESAGVLVSI